MTEPITTPGIDWTVLPERPWRVVAAVTDSGTVIAHQRGGMIGYASTHFPEADQARLNHLWAAAPDLYDALRAYVEHDEHLLEGGYRCDNTDCPGCGDDVARLADGLTAILKAEGTT